MVSPGAHADLSAESFDCQFSSIVTDTSSLCHTSRLGASDGRGRPADPAGLEAEGLVMRSRFYLLLRIISVIRSYSLMVHVSVTGNVERKAKLEPRRPSRLQEEAQRSRRILLTRETGAAQHSPVRLRLQVLFHGRGGWLGQRSKPGIMAAANGSGRPSLGYCRGHKVRRTGPHVHTERSLALPRSLHMDGTPLCLTSTQMLLICAGGFRVQYTDGEREELASQWVRTPGYKSFVGAGAWPHY